MKPDLSFLLSIWRYKHRKTIEAVQWELTHYSQMGKGLDSAAVFSGSSPRGSFDENFFLFFESDSLTLTNAN